MNKDDAINLYLYKMTPYNYQSARFTDWIRSFLENQRAELEKNNQYNYMKQKYETIMKSLKIMELVETKWSVIEVQNSQQY